MGERIDHSNYEAWLLDRLEGNLTAEQERELDTFLLLHPELAPSDDELPALNVDDAALSASEKNALKRGLPPVSALDDASIDDHLIARLEGDLTPVQLDALRAYLIDHPEHQRTERLYALTKLVPAAMAYAEKRESQRQLPPLGLPNAYNLEDFLVARLEGDLTREQENALDAILATDGSAQRSWRLINATHIVPEAIAYPDKSALKKGGRVIAIRASNWTVRLAAAASIAAIIGLGLWFLLQREPAGPQVAEEVKVQPGTPTPANDEQPGVNGPNEAQGTTVDEDAVTPKQKPGQNEPGRAPGRPSNGPVQPQFVPIQREEPLPIAEQRQVVPPVDRPHEVPADVPVPPVPMTSPEEPALAQTAARKSETTVGELLTATLRERVLDRPAREESALDADDAIAAVDKGLKAVSGDRAGLAVSRKADGRVGGFNLRLGRNLAIAQR